MKNKNLLNWLWTESHEKQSPQRFARYAAILIMLLTLGVGQMWGDDEISYSGGYIYFDNSLGINDNTLQICARQSSWTGVSSLSNIENTKLYYVANPQGSGWGGILGWVVISANPAKSNSNFDNWSSYTWCSDWNTYGFNSGSTYLIVPSSTSKSQSVTTTYYSGGYSALNSTQTINTVVKTGSGSYTSANSKATISITSYAMTGNGAVTKQTTSISTSAKTQTVSAARTATTTYTVGDVASGYQFDGWYTAATGGTQLSSSKTYTYYPTAATTVYARFSEKMSTVTLTASLSSWSITGGASISSTTDNPTTVTGGGAGTAATLTATFEADAVNSLTVEAGTHVTTVTGSTSPVTLGNKYAINATAFETGWQFLNWTATPAANGTFDNASSASTNVTVKNGSVVVTANAQEKMTTVTVNVSPTGTGTLTVGGAAFTPGNTTTAGVATSRTVVATAANDYAFSSWSVTGNATGTSSTNTYTLKGNGSAGTGTLTANFTTIPCKLYKLSAAKNGSTTDKGAMSYDATEHAYYKDITTDASPYYFRFYYNNSEQYCTDWKDKYSGGYTSGKQIDANGSKVACDQSVGGWGDKPAMYYSGESGTTIRIWFDFQNKKVWITADKDKQYVLRGANADDPSTAHGMPGWSATTSYFVGLASGNTGTISCSLNAGEWYHLKVYDMYNKTWYGTSTSGAKELTDGTLSTMGSYDDFYFGTTVADSYTFTLDKSSGMKIKVDYPVSYQLNYSIGSVAGTEGSISSSPSTASGSYIPSGNTVTLTGPAAKTGYTWKGWYTNAAGTEGKIADESRAITVTMNADKTLYACYTINNHAITHSDASHGSYTIKVGDASAISTNTTSDYGKTITLAATPATGYHFGSWSAYKTGTPATTVTVTSNQFTMPDYAVTVGATFSPTTYSITYHTNGGSAISAGSYNIETATFDLPTTSEKTGYTFAGWYTNSGLTGDPVASIAVGSYGDKEYWAKWTPNTYTVSFDVNGGTASTPDSKNVTYDAAYGTLPSGMTHTSKQFIGWYTDPDDGEGTHITAETIVSTAENHTLYAHYENVYSVNVNFKCGSDVIYPATSVDASPTSLAPTITAPEIFGYSFVNWTGTNVTFADASSATTTITATAATSVTANYSVVPTVYFKNNLGWENVYVTFDSYWKEVGGKQVPGNKDKPYYKMTQIGSSDVYYCVIPETYTTSDYAGWKGNIAFDNTNYGSTAETTHTGTYDPFYEGEFTGRGDFDPKATMFIPYNEDYETRNSGTFYKSGCWMKYNSTESGYQVKMNEWVTGEHAEYSITNLTAPAAGGYEFSATVYLGTANYSYGFKLYKEYQKNTTDLWYTNTGDITSATDNLPWAFWSGSEITADTRRCGLHTEALGDYKITVSFATGKPMVSVEYPVSTGDWKLIYKDLATWSGDAHTASWSHPSRVIKAKADAEDIVSFYVAYGSSPSIELYKCTAIDAKTGAETWTKQSDVSLTGISKKGVYNFKVSQNGSKEATVTLDGEYDGNFYIRTDASNGGWTNYKTSGKNLMTYSEYSLEHGGDFGPYSHYFMRFASKGTNIKFCLANDYSECITDTVVDDTYTGEFIAADGNVRFMWNSNTNKIGRTYISGSSVVSDRFLVLEGDAKMFDESGNALTTAGGGRISGLNDYEMKFTDDENWIYEATVKAQPGARIKLTAKYNDKIQYFYGEEGERSESTTDLLIGGSGSDKYKMRIVYDFKTNRLMRAFIPDATITTALDINADLMIIREHQEQAQQISFSGEGALSEVKTVYGAMKFNKYTVNGKEKEGGHAATGASRYERDLFYISFPFDVKLGDAFGFGEYGKHWIIEYYDGKGRAEKGFWADSEPNWKFVWPAQRSSFTMKAFEGYILALELDEMAESSSIWDNGVENVYVYFPSDGNVNNISATNRTITIDQEGYECKINRATPDGNRTVKDSYWHCIGVPSFANYNSALSPTSGGETIDWSDDDGEIDWSTPNLPYLYVWNRVDNSLSVTTSATFDFKATWSYLVQYAGTSIYWSQVNVTPASIVARERTAPTNAEFRIELQQGGEKTDQTFVRLTEEENVTTGFDFNYDLSKEYNKNRANIYTMVTTVKEGVASETQSAANVLPMSDQTTVVPVGVKIATTGDYTFAIPEGTAGVGVTLIDNETGIRTSLSALDYTINLSAGTYENRFVLEISPIKQMPTDIESVSDQHSAVRKVMVDGILYIVKDGKVFDARGAKVK